MNKMVLKSGWRFLLDDPQTVNRHSYWEKDFDDSNWRPVVVPHDWSVEHDFSREHSSGTGYLPGGVGWYRISFDMAPDSGDQPVWIEFDGVYKNSQVWCNGYYLGKRPSGYTPFRYRIDGLLKHGSGPVVIAVKVTHTDIADSRWFTGSGITRKVSLVKGDSLYIEPDSFFVTTDKVMEDQASLSMEMTLKNNSVSSQEGTLEVMAEGPSGDQVTLLSKEVTLKKDGSMPISESLIMESPMLWSAQVPNLYGLKAVFRIGTDVIQLHEMTLGIRTYEFNAQKGFFLNDRPLVLKGVCVHHDAGVLGAAVTHDVWLRRLRKLKDMGCNAIRCSHNPHMADLYELCDQLGFYVIDEAFDEWEGPKNKWSTGHNVYPPVHQGYFMDFPEWHERDLRAMILRGRNHPSILMWSIGNEIDYPNDPYCHPLFQEMTGNNDANKPSAERLYKPAKPNADRLPELASSLYDICKETDPSRPVTMAIAFPELSTRTGLIDLLDVVGYNYKEDHYEEDHQRFQDKPFLGSENGHDYQAWKAVLDHDYIAGQFLWTGFDFLGEAHGWPVRCSGAGIMTMAGFDKQMFPYRKSLWTQEAYIALWTATDDTKERHNGYSPLWDYMEGEVVHVAAFTNCKQPKLTINDKALGEGRFNEVRGYYEWELPYEAGLLEVTAERDGHKVADSLEPLARAYAINAKLWQDPLMTSSDLVQVEVTIEDIKGRPLWLDATMIEAHTEGQVALLGLENGDISDLTAYSSTRRRVYHGKLLVYLRKSGQGALILEGEGLKSHRLNI